MVNFSDITVGSVLLDVFAAKEQIVEWQVIEVCENKLEVILLGSNNMRDTLYREHIEEYTITLLAQKISKD